MHGERDPIARIAAFAQRASFETTRLSLAELEEVKAGAPAGCAIYVSAIPSRTWGWNPSFSARRT
jgi:hypothetical protein